LLRRRGVKHYRINRCEALIVVLDGVGRLEIEDGAAVGRPLAAAVDKDCRG
jgi:hypothetical protein